MYGLERISQVFQSSEKIIFDDSSRIVLMSDCHRGDGSWADDFLRNRHIYLAALTHYYNENYTYIELGDGDELWENKKFTDIMHMHSEAFLLLSKFIGKGRAYFLFGNHDMVKRKKGFMKGNSYRYFDRGEKECIRSYEDIKVHEGLILKYAVTGGEIFLIHGHQVDFLNDRLWKIGRFLSRRLWRPLNILGVNDPTSTAKNYKKKERIEKSLVEWVRRENQMLVAGHTHKPVFSETGHPPYFNDGSCVHPGSITAMEIEDGNIVLVRWSVKAKNDGTLFVGREVLGGPNRLKDYLV